MPSFEKVVAKVITPSEHVGAWLVTSAMVGLLLLQIVAPHVGCCTVSPDQSSGVALTALSTLASGI